MQYIVIWSYCDPCIVIRIVLWGPCQYKPLVSKQTTNKKVYILSATYLHSTWGLVSEGGRVGWPNSSLNSSGREKGTPTWTDEGTAPNTKTAALFSERDKENEQNNIKRGIYIQ